MSDQFSTFVMFYCNLCCIRGRESNFQDFHILSFKLFVVVVRFCVAVAAGTWCCVGGLLVVVRCVVEVAVSTWCCVGGLVVIVLYGVEVKLCSW